jgi:hypothetical protein
VDKLFHKRLALLVRVSGSSKQGFRLTRVTAGTIVYLPLLLKSWLFPKSFHTIEELVGQVYQKEQTYDKNVSLHFQKETLDS